MKTNADQSVVFYSYRTVNIRILHKDQTNLSLPGRPSDDPLICPRATPPQASLGPGSDLEINDNLIE